MIRNKVMVVDDNTVTLQTLAIALEARGFLVVQRRDPIGTGAAIVEETPEVLLLDVEMPLLRGDALVKMFGKRASFPKVWVIFHSSLPKDELDRLVRETGVAGAIHKSDLKEFLADFEVLLARLRRTPFSLETPG